MNSKPKFKIDDQVFIIRGQVIAGPYRVLDVTDKYQEFEDSKQINAYQLESFYSLLESGTPDLMGTPAKESYTFAKYAQAKKYLMANRRKGNGNKAD